MSKDKFIPYKEESKCAPSKTYSEGSCFSVESLQKLATSYNNEVGLDSNQLILITDSKIDLINKISKRITECGNDQLCWLNVDWVKNTNDIDILKNTFRPAGPQTKFTWLNTTNINEIMIQYNEKYTDFKFLGAVPYDFEEIPQLGINNMDFNELVDSGITKIGMVINFDEHWKEGSHWVGLYANLAKDQIYYFDSYGSKPKKKISNFVKRIALWCYIKHHLTNKNKESDSEFDTESEFMKTTKNKYEKKMDIEFNRNRHQFLNSECGVYSVNFILRLLKGEAFGDICNVITPDIKINECRKTYFRFN